MSFKPIAALAIDSYKLGHHNMYPEGTTKSFANFTPRSDKHSPIPKKYRDGKVVVFGHQFVLHELESLWNETFFSRPWNVVAEEIIDYVSPFVGDMGFEKGLANFKELHEIGYLPLEIKSIEEGSVVEIKTPVLTITNTLPGFYWLVGYIETFMSQEMWKMSTVATIARAYRKILTKYADETGGSKEFIPFQAHDFSARGLSGYYDNAQVGAAHLTSFMGTDSLLGVQLLKEYYNGNEIFIGASVPASEHSVMTAMADVGEFEQFQSLLAKYPKGIVSIVSDSYDFWKVITTFTVRLREQILAREFDSLGLSKVVFRPDSGDPADILCGTAYAIKSMDSVVEMLHKKHGNDILGKSIIVVKDGTYTKCTAARGRDSWVIVTEAIAEPTPEMKGAVQCLYEVFGGTINDLGYTHLCNRVGLIYGDSITMKRADEILSRLKDKGFASDCVVFGIGSYSYQFLTRDTFGYAMKSTYQECNGVSIEIFKDPKTDDGIKKSAKGLLRVEKVDGHFVTYDQQTWLQESQGELKTIFKDGNFMNRATLVSIRENLLK